MTRPARQRPGATSDVGRRLTPHVEGLMPSDSRTASSTTSDTATPDRRQPATPASSGPPRPAQRPTPAAEAKEPLSTRVPAATLAAARAAVMATMGQPGGCRSLADLVTQAIEAKVQQLQHDLNDGAPFADPGHFRSGRPLG